MLKYSNDCYLELQLILYIRCSCMAMGPPCLASLHKICLLISVLLSTHLQVGDPGSLYGGGQVVPEEMHNWQGQPGKEGCIPVAGGEAGLVPAGCWCCYCTATAR
jgi:hypothetical protein